MGFFGEIKLRYSRYLFGTRFKSDVFDTNKHRPYLIEHHPYGEILYGGGSIMLQGLLFIL